MAKDTSPVESLNRANEKLLQLSAEIGKVSPTAEALIKELLGDIRRAREEVQQAVRGGKGADEETARLQKELDRQRLLLKISEQFHSTLDTDEIAERILDSILEWAGADRGLILIQDPGTGEQVVRVGRELSEFAYNSAEIAIPRTIVGRVLKERRAIYATDIHSDGALMAIASIRDLNVRSLACLPLVLDNEIPGVIYFDYQAATRRIGPDERDTLGEVCRHAALALRNAGRYQRAREWARKSNLAGIGKIIGTSPEMRGVYELVNQVALSPSTSVLITGASGTGKELVARAIHDLSSRAAEPFVPVNCAAIPSTLLESELFGYEKGAFTDAKTRRLGLVEQAEGGTLFLDEIAEMSPQLQSKILRVLEDRTFRRLGGNKDIAADIRVIAATNVDIDKAVESGEFRDDLFYRLNVFPISLPLLKDRGEDILLIANAFIDELNSRLGTRIRPMDPSGDVADALLQYDWPGNVRELRNVLERAMIVARTDDITLADLPAPLGRPEIDRLPARGKQRADMYSTMDEGERFALPPRHDEYGRPMGKEEFRSPKERRQYEMAMESAKYRTLKDVEREHIRLVLDATGGNKARAAKILGINPTTLWRKLKEEG